MGPSGPKLETVVFAISAAHPQRCQICDPPFPLQTPKPPKNSKTQKSYSKVTFGLLAEVTQKLLKSDSEVTKAVQKVTFESLLSNF